MIRVDAKLARALVIRDYCARAGLRGVVAFSCGNATAALQRTGLFVVDVAPGGSLVAGRWWQPDEIRRTWPDLLDATSGHLPAPLMRDVGAALRRVVGPLDPQVDHVVPSGSGETLVCLAWAYPSIRFVARYDDRAPATTWQAGAPLNDLVRALAVDVVRVSASRCTRAAPRRRTPSRQA